MRICNYCKKEITDDYYVTVPVINKPNTFFHQECHVAEKDNLHQSYDLVCSPALADYLDRETPLRRFK